jgi:NAD(P)-dependent dehydrogenase (short-subunit alcohol dehydrogenase family)
MDLQLAGRVAVVTGGSQGIGLAVVHTLLAEGARVVAASRTTSTGLTELAQRFGPDLRHIPIDLLDQDSPARLLRLAADEFGGVDILVNNAGGTPPGVVLPRESFLDAVDADWRAVFEWNLFSAVRACRAAIPLLLARGGGAIVNVSSVNARQAMAMNVDYGAAKAAMTNLTKALSEEFAPQGIRVNTVSPGPVRTPWWTGEGAAADQFAARVGTDRENVLATVLPNLLNLTTGRLAEPQEIADVIALLVSPRSGSTTGTEVVVDSGMLKAV